MRMRRPKRLGSQVPGLTVANSPAKFFRAPHGDARGFIPPVVGVLGVLFEISIVCLFLCCFVCLVFAGCVLGASCWVCLGCAWLVLFVWVVLVPGGLVFPGFWCLLGTGFFGEFDPGSGRTLAACLTHASRTGLLLVGGLVANG